MNNSKFRTRLTVTIGTLGPGGAERNLSILANRWAERGFDISIVTLTGPIESFYRMHPAIRISTAPCPRRSEIFGKLIRKPWVFQYWLKFLSLHTIRHALTLREAVKLTTPDLVLSFMDECNALTLLALRGTQYPVVAAVRSDPGTMPLSLMWRTLRSLLYPLADAVVVQTNGAAAFFKGRVAQKLSIIPNPIIVPDTKGDPDIRVPRPAIVALGRFTEEKRFVDLIDAFASISQQHPTWSLVIAGDGPLRGELERHVNIKSLADRVLMPGLTRNSGGFLKQGDIFVLSSRFEGFPTALCEAMALGTAIVSTDCPSGPRVIVRDGVDGILVPPLDAKALAAALDCLIRSPDLRGRLGAAARAVTQRFDLEPIVARWELLFGTVREGRNGRHSDAGAKQSRATTLERN